MYEIICLCLAYEVISFQQSHRCTGESFRAPAPLNSQRNKYLVKKHILGNF